MTTSATATYRIDEALHGAFWALIFRRSIGRCLPWIVIGLGVGLVIAAAVSEGEIDFVLAIVAGVVGACAILGIQWLRLPFRAAKVFRESAALKEVQTFSLSDDGFSIEQASGVWRCRWIEISKWDETPELFAIFPNRMMAYLLPKDQVGPQLIDGVRVQLVASGLDRRGKLRK